jgi:hypothetical protein
VQHLVPGGVTAAQVPPRCQRGGQPQRGIRVVLKRPGKGLVDGRLVGIQQPGGGDPLKLLARPAAACSAIRTA